MCLSILSLPGFDPKFVTSAVVAAATGDVDAVASNADTLQRHSTACGIRHQILRREK
jgi:hypothetical protein